MLDYQSLQILHSAFPVTNPMQELSALLEVEAGQHKSIVCVKIDNLLVQLLMKIIEIAILTQIVSELNTQKQMIM